MGGTLSMSVTSEWLRTQSVCTLWSDILSQSYKMCPVFFREFVFEQDADNFNEDLHILFQRKTAELSNNFMDMGRE